MQHLYFYDDFKVKEQMTKANELHQFYRFCLETYEQSRIMTVFLYRQSVELRDVMRVSYFALKGT